MIKKIAPLFLSTVILSQADPVKDHLVFEPEGKANGKHLVLLSGDEEYRSEEAMPMMAQILAKQGFKATVLFSVDDKGIVTPTNSKSLSHPVALDSADGLIMSLRFRDWDDVIFAKFDAALNRGVPIIALRTSTHAFNTKPGSKYARYGWKAKADTGWEKGFGRQVLGETWVSHHGHHKFEGTRTHVEVGQEKNPLLNGVGQIFGTTDVYGANPLKPATILLRGEVTKTLDPASPGVDKKNKPVMQPVAWSREFKNSTGKTNQILTTTMGAASDLTEESLRRLIVNAAYQFTGLAVPAKADVTLPEGYKPLTYGFNTFRKGFKPVDFISGGAAHQAKGQPAKKKSQSNKGKKLDKAPPVATPQVATPAKPAGPSPIHPAVKKGTPPTALNLAKNSRIALIGGGLGSRMNVYSHFETQLHLHAPQHDLYIRNFCKEGDTPAFRPHPSRKSYLVIPDGENLVKAEFRYGKGRGHYETPDQWNKLHRIDTVIGFFGYSESFEGSDGIPLYKKELRAFIKHTLNQKYSGNPPQLALISPAAFEDLSAIRDLPNGEKTNANLAAYTAAMAEVCQEEGILFIDAHTLTQSLYNNSKAPLTANGHNLTAAGYKALALALVEKLFGKPSGKSKSGYAKIHAAVTEKNRLWLLDYKIPNGVHVHGGRYRPFGKENYPDELKKTRQMTHLRDEAIWATNKNQPFDLAAADAKTIELKDMPTNSKRPNEYISGQDMISKFTLPKGYKVELFASEEKFPDLVNPSQMAFDNRGRLWVSCMQSYPHYRIGDPAPTDKIIIFEDTDNDGKADKQTNFLEDIHIPMGFEITEHGVYISLGNDIVLYKDTDGDDKADFKQLVLSGFDDHDTHHAISSFCADPSGAIYMGEGVFLQSNVETPYGTVRGTNGGFYRFNPNKGHLERTAQYKIPNPWGIAFDDWGQNFFIHTSGTSFSWMQRGAIKSKYSRNIGAPDLLSSNRVRPTSGVEFVSSRHFPDEVQGDFIICNNIGFQGAKQHKITPDGNKAGYKTEFRHNLFKSSNPNLRPVDLEFAPDGSLYFLDWSNVLIGHMQHSIRDPKRDHQHGRIYRVTYPSRPLVKPAKIHGASLSELLENLKVPEIRTRYRVRRELRGRELAQPGTVGPAISDWVKTLDPKDERTQHHLTEAMWVSWGINKIDVKLVELLLSSKDYRARAAVTRAVRYNADQLPKYLDYLIESASDKHAHVRHEAIIAASWLPNNEEGLQVIAAAEKFPIDRETKDAYKYAKADLQGKIVVTDLEEVTTPKHLENKRELRKQYVKGYRLYNEGENCASCHQKNGQGLPNAFPPLDGSEWVTGDKDLLSKIALHGVIGEFEVKGKKYNGAMPGYAHRIDNEEIADILTYVRNAWSNTTGDGFTTQEIDKVLKATSKQKGMYTEEELKKAHPFK